MDTREISGGEAMSDNLDELERSYIKQIEAIREEYQRAIQPYVDKLVQIRSLRMPKPIIMSKEEWDVARNGTGPFSDNW